jgi:predicted secreted hydrolase
VEWWYFNGHLKDKKGNGYAFMKCLFRVDPKKVKIPFLEHNNLPELYFYHSILCDLKKKKTDSVVYPIVNLSKDSFPKEGFYANYSIPLLSGPEHRMEKLGQDKYHIKNEFVDLSMVSKTPPLLECETGFVKMKTKDFKKTTYYYSLPHLETSGKIFIDGKWIDVKGKSWMDHQWSNEKFDFDRWDWFSAQLDDNTDLMCVSYGKGDKSIFASIMHPDHTSISTSKVSIIPKKKKWKSPDTGAEYPLEWDISMPSEKIKLKAKAMLESSEVIFGIINYWEGPIEFSGTVKGKKVKGKGFMELVGYPMHKSKVKFLENEMIKTSGDYLKLIKAHAPEIKKSILESIRKKKTDYMF